MKCKILIVIVMLNCFNTGCGIDEAVEDETENSYEGMGGGAEDDTDRLYEELDGEYELVRSIVKYADGGETLHLKPLEVTGIMTITLNRQLRQEVEVQGNRVIAEGSF